MDGAHRPPRIVFSGAARKALVPMARPGGLVRESSRVMHGPSGQRDSGGGHEATLEGQRQNSVRTPRLHLVWPVLKPPADVVELQVIKSPRAFATQV